jgi:RNA polymerase sigma factor (sigma-70 family)
MEHSGADLYEQHAQQVYRYLFSLSREADTAEELTQETFCQALKGLSSFRGESSPQVWLFAIAKRLWFKELERRKRTAPMEEQTLVHLMADDDPAAELERRDKKYLLYQAMQRLDSETREVVYLRLAGDFSFREIGSILGHTEVWARVRFYRGKERLAQLLGGDPSGET